MHSGKSEVMIIQCDQLTHGGTQTRPQNKNKISGCGHQQQAGMERSVREDIDH